MKLLCAWCPASAEKTPEDQSHGVCDEHADKLELQSKQRQFDKVPSYFGEREKFEQYREKRKQR